MMRRYNATHDEHYRGLARERLVIGDIFAHDIPVVTVMTRARAYGSLSRAVAARGITIPDLALGCAEYVSERPGKGIIFVALWDEHNAYSAELIYACTRAVVRQASSHLLAAIAFPLLGGNQALRFLGAMEQAVDHAEDDADERGAHMPEVVFVTSHEVI